jgi:4-hydroxy-tetrahydrodipicolinate synthase
MTRFEGVWVPMVTPFRYGRVDVEAAQRLAAGLADDGVHGLVVCGTTGEAATLSATEQNTLLSAVLEAAGSRCPVVMGISGCDTRAMADRVTRLEDRGIAGFLVSAPAYVRPSQEGILLHFRTIASSTGRPILIYNIPYRTGVNIEPATVKALSTDGRFAAIKECGGNIQQLMDLINETPLKVLCGEDSLTFVTLCLGGHGAIAASAHIRPDLHVRLFELIRAGQIERARSISRALLPLIRLLFSEPNPGPVKTALALQGKITEELRMPMMSASEGCRKQLESALERVMALRM